MKLCTMRMNDVIQGKGVYCKEYWPKYGALCDATPEEFWRGSLSRYGDTLGSVGKVGLNPFKGNVSYPLSVLEPLEEYGVGDKVKCRQAIKEGLENEFV